MSKAVPDTWQGGRAAGKVKICEKRRKLDVVLRLLVGVNDREREL